jgi:catechol 2,3-dioxygenase
MATIRRSSELNEVPGARPHPEQSRLGLYHFAILLPTRSDLARFVAHVAPLGMPMGAGDHLVSEAFYLSDPDGLGIEVYADRPRDAWVVQNGQLVMGVDPVDMRDLLAAADDSTWTGMPSGTTIGHVHLHVAHLGDAEAFYHAALGLDKVFRMPSALFLSAGGYHHHLGTNTWAGKAPHPAAGDARLLEWTIVLPSATDVSAVEQSLNGAGFTSHRDGDGLVVDDPWGTRIRLSAA